MTKQINILGLSESTGSNPALNISENLRWFIRNVELMEMAFNKWELKEIDDTTLSIAMDEGFQKLYAFHEEFDKDSMRAMKDRKRTREDLQAV